MSDSKSKCDCHDCRSVFQGSCTTRLQYADMRVPLVRLAAVAPIGGHGKEGTLFEGFKAEDCENKSVKPKSVNRK